MEDKGISLRQRREGEVTSVHSSVSSSKCHELVCAIYLVWCSSATQHGKKKTGLKKVRPDFVLRLIQGPAGYYI